MLYLYPNMKYVKAHLHIWFPHAFSCIALQFFITYLDWAKPSYVIKNRNAVNACGNRMCKLSFIHTKLWNLWQFFLSKNEKIVCHRLVNKWWKVIFELDYYFGEQTTFYTCPYISIKNLNFLTKIEFDSAYNFKSRFFGFFAFIFWRKMSVRNGKVGHWRQTLKLV